jgi:hypothetical protein
LMDCGGAVPIDEGARCTKRALGGSEGARGALERKQRREQWALGVEERGFPLLLSDL